MYCIKCGHQLVEGSRYCHICGAAQTAPPPLAPPSVSAVSSTPVPKKPESKLQTAIKKVPLWVIIVFIAASSFSIWYFYFDRDPIQDVKDHVFSDYGPVSLEEALSAVMANRVWTVAEVGRDYEVTVSGNVNGKEATITFYVSYHGRTPDISPNYATDGYYVLYSAGEIYDEVISHIYRIYGAIHALW